MTINDCYKMFAELIGNGYGDREVVFRFHVPYGESWPISKFLTLKDSKTSEIFVAAMTDAVGRLDVDAAPGKPLPRGDLDEAIVAHGILTDSGIGRPCKTVESVSEEKLLFKLARDKALEKIHLWDAPEVVKSFLLTGDEALRTAAHESLRAAARKAREAEAGAVTQPWEATEILLRALRDAATELAEEAEEAAKEAEVLMMVEEEDF